MEDIICLFIRKFAANPQMLRMMINVGGGRGPLVYSFVACPSTPEEGRHESGWEKMCCMFCVESKV